MAIKVLLISLCLILLFEINKTELITCHAVNFEFTGLALIQNLLLDMFDPYSARKKNPDKAVGALV